MLERDPFVSAVWSLDQAREFDLPGTLDDVEHHCWRAEREIIAQRTRSKLRQTSRYKQLHGRISALRDAEYRASCALWRAM